MKKLCYFALLCTSLSVFAGDESEAYAPTKVEPKLNVEVRENTDVVHFVRDNADPDVITKAYILKHAQAYELRRYLREMVQARKVDASNTGITALTYGDGVQCVLISAEDYRFDDSEEGQGFDSLIQMLDSESVKSITGQIMYAYLPRYRPAFEMERHLRNVGASVADDVTEAIGGSDCLVTDDQLNLLFMKIAPFSYAHINTLLQEYDRPYPEIRAEVKLYELTAENDKQLGLDFQSWKNNDGIDFFSAAGRFRRNVNPDGTFVNGVPYSRTHTIGFNPKWNTRFLDFLVSKSKAHVVHSTEINLRHGKSAALTKTNSLLYAAFTDNPDSPYERGRMVNTEVSDSYGLVLCLSANITTQGAILDIDLNNSSLIGYTSDGQPRIQRDNRIKTRVTVPNGCGEIIIGGLERAQTVESESGIPLLCDIPLLGYLFSTKSPSVKRSKQVLTLRLLPAGDERSGLSSAYQNQVEAEE